MCVDVQKALSFGQQISASANPKAVLQGVFHQSDPMDRIFQARFGRCFSFFWGLDVFFFPGFACFGDVSYVCLCDVVVFFLVLPVLPVDLLLLLGL